MHDQKPTVASRVLEWVRGLSWRRHWVLWGTLAVLLLTDLGLATGAFDPGAESRDRERYHQRLRFLMNRRPKDASIRFQFANHLRSVGMNDEAIVYYRRCLKLEPGHVQARWFLALTLRDKGYPREAFNIVRALMEEFPEDASLYDEASRLLDQMDQPAVAKEYRDRYWQLVNLPPDQAATVRTTIAH